MAESIVGLILVGVGALGAVAFAAFVRGDEPRQLLFSAAALVVAATGYLIPLFAGQPLHPAALISFVIFAAFAVGTLRSPWILIVGWLLHAGWDIVAHFIGLEPLFGVYVPLCLGFDVVFAALLTLRHAISPEQA